MGYFDEKLVYIVLEQLSSLLVARVHVLVLLDIDENESDMLDNSKD
jgi:hypothetical protein